jgi:putative sigma-54 modulation protein
MKIEFAEKKMTDTDSIRAYAEKKLKKFERYFKRGVDARVAMSVEQERNTAEIRLHTEGTYFRATSTTNDMYSSIDSCVASIVRQIHKFRTKLEKRMQVKGFEPSENVDYTPADDSEFKIIRRKFYNLKPITTEEAILQMKLLSHAFYVFRDSDKNGAFSVVYSRKDGGYGLISEE